MGQKVHPHGFRLGFNKTWRSRWFADKDYSKLLNEDLKLRDTLKKRFAHAGVYKIEIERAANKLKIDIYTSRPGIIIGRKGTEVDKLKQEIQKKTNRELFINIQEIQKATRRQPPGGPPGRSERAWRSAARCARRSSRRCASARAASRCGCRAG